MIANRIASVSGGFWISVFVAYALSSIYWGFV